MGKKSGFEINKNSTKRKNESKKTSSEDPEVEAPSR